MQGTTLQYAFIDVKDLNNPVNNKIITENDEDFTTERNTLLYVAFSRCKKISFAYE
jgi:hypothetical protein